MVEILCGEFAKSHEPSNLTKEQGSYGKCFKRFKLKRGRIIDSNQPSPLDSTVDSHFGVSGVEVPKSLHLDS
jgi:hypothetical protein